MLVYGSWSEFIGQELFLAKNRGKTKIKEWRLLKFRENDRKNHKIYQKN